MKLFYQSYAGRENLAPLVREIGWSHNLAIMETCKGDAEREFYLRRTPEHGWTKNVLIHQIENRTHTKTLAGQTNLEQTLPPPGFRSPHRITGRWVLRFVFPSPRGRLCAAPRHVRYLLMPYNTRPPRSSTRSSVPERKQEVLERVREELTKRPTLALGVLHQMALQIDPSLETDPRSFHARYVMPIRFEMAAEQLRRAQTRKPRRKRAEPSSRSVAGPEARSKLEGQKSANTKAPGASIPRKTFVAAVKSRKPQAPLVQEEPRAVAERARSDPLDGAQRSQQTGVDRERIRSVFFELARDVAGAKTPAEVVQVLIRLDRYVDRVALRSD